MWRMLNLCAHAEAEDIWEIVLLHFAILLDSASFASDFLGENTVGHSLW